MIYVTDRHWRIFCHSYAIVNSKFTCSTIEASRPSAKPLLSSRVITALPSLITKRRAYFN